MNQAATAKSKQVIKGVFSLTNHDGVRITNESYRGRYLLVFFGFTHCRVVCPRNLGRISATLDSLGELADRIQPLYVTVDPARDTPSVMKTFLQQSYPRFTGLTGSSDEIEAAKQSFRVFAQRKDDPNELQGYVVPHTAITYLLGPDGTYLAHFADRLDEMQLGERLRTLIADSTQSAFNPDR